MVLSNEGQVLYRDVRAAELSRLDTESGNWASFIKALDGIREADFIFENCRVYVRESAGGYILVLMGHFAPVAMVRLNCDIVLPSLKQVHASKGLARFFKRKR
ncbi:MAG: hypothetical protein K9M82_03970 [Deltaproteobacteria bacterium]|nr:hypothetical protein [Deltaproteobacteria bacterium]